MKNFYFFFYIFLATHVAAFSQVTESKSNVAPFAICSGLGVESGWGDWKATDGYLKYGEVPVGPKFFSSKAPQAPKYTVMTGGGIDQCTQNTLGNPTIPVVCPGFGNSSIRLGEPRTNGNQGGCTNNGQYPPQGTGVQANGCSERLTYSMTVTAKDTNFIYAYALVIDNPSEAHLLHEAPFAEIYMLDAKGDTVKCSHRKYVADLKGGIGPGFYSSTTCFKTSQVPGGPNEYTITYKPWTVEGINLNKYVGETLTVVITNSDCAKGGHYCYSYWDFSCGVLSSDPASYCVGNSVSITAPSSTLIKYEYQWYKNNVPYTPNGTNQTITPKPQPGDTFMVEIKQGGCNFRIVYVPNPLGVKPDFKFNSVGACGSGTYNFQDLSGSSTGGSIISWKWSFPGGTPASSTDKNPTNIKYEQGTYTASLIVTTSDGCIDTIQKSFTYLPGKPPVAAAVTTPVCFNQKATQFTDKSTGDTPISSWEWDFGDGNKSTDQNPTHTFSNPGTFTVTLIVIDGSGCKDTVPLKAIVNPLPVPNFVTAPVCLGDTTCFTDQSSISPGAITSWNWSFGDPASGLNNTSNAKNPCHVYSGPGPFTVVLTVTSDSGCQNTTSLPATTLPPPTAAFTMPSACIGTATTFTDSSTPFTSTDPITTWSWDFGDGGVSTIQHPTHSYTSPGTYTTTLVITTQGGCKDTTTRTVTLYRPPVALYSDSAKGCAPLCATFKDLSQAVDGTIASWEWGFPGGSPSSANTSSPKICWNEPGVYDVQLTVTNSHGCKNTVTTPRYIHVYPWPNADFTVAPNIAPAENPTFLFNHLWDTTGVIDWNWHFGDGTIDTSNTTKNPIHSYSATATLNDFYTFNVCVDVKNKYGCWDSICHPVEILPEFEFYIPNTFTPKDGNPANETFFGKCRGVKEYQIWVFDRWGNLIWDCNVKGKNTDYDTPNRDGLSAECKWDGVVEKGAGPADMNGRSGNLVQEDVYVWKVKLLDIFGKRHNYIGHVSSVR